MLSNLEIHQGTQMKLLMYRRSICSWSILSYRLNVPFSHCPLLGVIMPYLFLEDLMHHGIIVKSDNLIAIGGFFPWKPGSLEKLCFQNLYIPGKKFSL